MANWCSNIITFYGSRRDEVLNEFKSIEGKEEGHTFDYITNNHHYFFSVWIEGDEVVMETKWSPPIEEITEICKNYDVTCEMYYEELGNMIYGCYKWNGKEGFYWDIEEIDIRDLTFDDDGNPYWKGDPIDSEYDLYEDILAEKMSKSE
jgi:hypothetical protein